MSRHADPEDLALVALGEPASPTTAAHLETCEVCRGEVDSLAQVVRAGRQPVELERPGEHVWDRIAAQIAEESGGTGGGSGRGATTVAGEEPTGAEPTGAVEQRTGEAGPDERGPSAGGAEPSSAPVVSLDARRRRRTMLLAVAASAAIGVVGTLGVQSLLEPDPTPSPSPVAQAVLDPLPGWDATGTAVLEQDPDGDRVLRVDLTDVSTDGYREVWLISTDLQRLISVGVLVGDSGTFRLPDGIDLTDFAVVDISDEPPDGDPAHSGNSIVRGELA